MTVWNNIFLTDGWADQGFMKTRLHSPIFCSMSMTTYRSTAQQPLFYEVRSQCYIWSEVEVFKFHYFITHTVLVLHGWSKTSSFKEINVKHNEYIQYYYCISSTGCLKLESETTPEQCRFHTLQFHNVFLSSCHRNVEFLHLYKKIKNTSPHLKIHLLRIASLQQQVSVHSRINQLARILRQSNSLPHRFDHDHCKRLSMRPSPTL